MPERWISKSPARGEILHHDNIRLKISTMLCLFKNIKGGHMFHKEML